MAVVQVGHLMISDLASGQAANQIVANFGLENAAEAVQAEFDAHNAVVQDIVAEIATPAVSRMEAHGASGTMKMMKAGEHSRVPTQKIGGAYNLGYPIFKNQISLGWTDEWFRRKTVAELAAQVMARRQAHIQMVYADIRNALWQSPNYTHQDEWEDPPLSIPVKRLANADGQYIAPSPGGTTFDGATHTHYLASGTLTNAVGLSLVNTVIEHQPTAGLRLVVAQADASAWQALADFRGYNFPGTQPVLGTLTQDKDITRLDDVAIGRFGAAEVWIKPWGVPSYPAVYDPQRKPLRYRERQGVGLTGLFIAAQNRAFPWLAEFAEAYYGFGVWLRTGAAVLYVGSSSYVDPVFTA